MLKFIPNLLTLLNLSTGCLAVIFLLEDRVEWVPFCILMSAVFDFFDGFAARLFKVSGPLGKELDSLADMISFGLVPGLIMYHYLGETAYAQQYAFFPYLGIIITLASCYRLAVFNISTNQGNQFIGVPTPAVTLFFLSYPIIEFLYPDFLLKEFLFRPELMILFTLVFTYLLNAKFTLIAMKFKDYSFKEDNLYRYVLILGIVIGLSLFQLAAMPFIILWYIILSIIQNIGSKN